MTSMLALEDRYSPRALIRLLRDKEKSELLYWPPAREKLMTLPAPPPSVPVLPLALGCLESHVKNECQLS